VYIPLVTNVRGIAVIYVNNGKNDVVLCGDNICRVVIRPSVSPVTETINVVYPDCGECFSSGGQECV
jgi:hypothetical protein